MRRQTLLSTLLLGMTSAAIAAVAPVTATSAYNQPPKEILDVMRAASPPSPLPSPTHDKLMLVTMDDYPSIAWVATPYLRLAGVRIEPGNRSQHDTPGGYGIPPCVSAIDLVQIADGKQTAVKLPAGACPRRPVWSADGQRFAFENITASAVELWLGDARTGAVRRIPGVRLNQMFGDQVQWMPDQKTLVVKLVSAQKAPLDAPPGSDGPGIQESLGAKGQSSTYENRDTLRNRHDEELFNFYGTSQLALVDAATGKITHVGKPGLYAEVDVAPDGRHAVVAEIRPPYSYVTTFDRFPQQFDLWDLSKGAHPKLRDITARPLADRVPNRGVPTGPRNFAWRPTDAATLTWVEALDGGDPNVAAAERDKLMMLKAPFTQAPVEIVRTEQRFAGIFGASSRAWRCCPTTTSTANGCAPGRSMSTLRRRRGGWCGTCRATKNTPTRAARYFASCQTASVSCARMATRSGWPASARRRMAIVRSWINST